MLRNLTDNNLGPTNKHSDAILRHKVRNLRAKVKCLLPIDICKKYNKRNKDLKQVQQRRQFLKTQDFKRQWRVPKYTFNQTQWFCQNKNHEERKHMFQKLTQDQIQQIKEDKFYYLGNDHIQAFQEFLISKNYIMRILKTSDGSGRQFDSNKENDQTSFFDKRKIEDLISKRKHKKTSSQLKQLQNIQNVVSSVNKWFQQIDMKRKKDSNLSSNCSGFQTNKNKYGSTQNKLDVFYEKRKLLAEQFNYKKQMDKLAAQRKQIKAQNKFFQLRNLKYQSIKNRNIEDQKKGIHARKIVRQKLKIGQIKGITQKLRQICLSKSIINSKNS